MKRKSLILLIALAMIMSLLSACGGSSGPASSAAPSASSSASSSAALSQSGEPAIEPLHLKIAHAGPNEDSTYQIGMLKFKEVVEAESGGAITVEVHCGTMGIDDAEIAEKLQLGAIDMALLSPGHMTRMGVQELDIFSLMYLFNSYEHWEKVMDGEIGQKLADIVYEKTNHSMKIVGYYCTAPRHYYGGRKVEKIEDFKGLKLRLQQSQVVHDAWEAVGVIPTVIAWNELYQALMQGVVDGAENDYSTMVKADQYNTPNGKYFAETYHDFPTRPLFYHGERWEKLSDAHRAIIEKGLEASVATQRQAVADDVIKDKQKFLDNGGTIVTLPEEEILKFQEVCIPIQDQLCAEIGMSEVLEEIRAIG